MASAAVRLLAHLVFGFVDESITECSQAVWAAVQEAVPLTLGVAPHNVLPAGQEHTGGGWGGADKGVRGVSRRCGSAAMESVTRTWV